MKKIHEILKRSKFSNILLYLMYATGENETMIKKYDSTIEESYETFFDEMENLYEDVHREDKKLLEALEKFVHVHEDTYFETGILEGVQLYQSLSRECESIIDQITNLETKKQMVSTMFIKDSILESICIHRLETALEESLRNDMEYQKGEKEIQTMIQEISEIGLTNFQWTCIDAVLSAYGERSAEYGKMAYIQGVKDIMNLIATTVD